MADKHLDAGKPAGRGTGKDKRRTGGRPSGAAPQSRSFGPAADDPIPHSVAEGRLGPGADPAEGKP